MFMELLSQLLNDASPFYFYISLFWTATGAIKLIHMNAPFKQRLHVKYTTSLKYEDGMIEAPFTENMDIQTKLTNMFKRIDAPNDDSDDHHASSRIIETTLIRGGQQWKQRLYSRSLKSMV